MTNARQPSRDGAEDNEDDENDEDGLGEDLNIHDDGDMV